MTTGVRDEFMDLDFSNWSLNLPISLPAPGKDGSRTGVGKRLRLFGSKKAISIRFFWILKTFGYLAQCQWTLLAIKLIVNCFAAHDQKLIYSVSRRRYSQTPRLAGNCASVPANTNPPDLASRRRLRFVMQLPLN